ncbi:MAG: hypothetical protein ABH851_03865 [Methanobacteriota archaeon]
MVKIETVEDSKKEKKSNEQILAGRVSVALTKLDTLARMRHKGLKEEQATKIKEALKAKMVEVVANLDRLVRTPESRPERKKTIFTF